MAKIQRIDPNRPLIDPNQVVRRRIEPAAVGDSVAVRERDSAVHRLVALEREVADLKERLRLANAIIKEWVAAGHIVFDEDDHYIEQLLDPTQPIPSPVVTVAPEEV